MPDNPLPPVLLLTGTNAAAWTMDNVKLQFEAAGYDCHGLTYRYHDMPPGPERDAKLVGLSIADYVEDALAAIDDIGAAPIVIGHSLGGVVAQLLAAQGRIKAGVMLNSSLMNGVVFATDGERDLGKMFISAGAFWEQALGQDLELLAQFGLNTLPDGLQREIHARLGTESGRVLFEFMFWMFDSQQTTWVDPDAVTCPLLFLSGTEDKAVSTATAERMAARYSTADFMAVEGACHYMQFDTSWADTAARILAWLDTKV